MLKTFDEMTAEQRLAYKMGYEQARRDLANGERVEDPPPRAGAEPDYEAAAEALFVATREGIAESIGEQVIPESWYTWDTAGPELREQYRNQAKATVDAAIGGRLLIDYPTEEEA